MEKIKQFLQWAGIDGLLHFLSCYALMSLALLIGLWWALAITITIAAAKEIVDYFIQKDNDIKDVLHDVIFDVLGILAAMILLLWWCWSSTVTLW